LEIFEAGYMSIMEKRIVLPELKPDPGEDTGPDLSGFLLLKPEYHPMYVLRKAC